MQRKQNPAHGIAPLGASGSRSGKEDGNYAATQASAASIWAATWSIGFMPSITVSMPFFS